mmetsp:Transcript_16756/g.36430  ORF Transcript_16756/g.36430 Transcript_16756/m.36430 type:complete len:265 (-) Transcript_16756:504-1298(-)|eukprot:CAMPEP_0118947952 /NCGR_PEP_ID=MMETSP1169-20130426/46971_1 /TAXON_ID=36882 /ORGANISM="Pyramimonas obovata, Strain CCMP722" /LENGTH=264 /DNA_ID=CAMNT_0006894273 /DNA_START=135 /DNA_END=929 /DNA_ORIENTATION=+
MSCVIGARWAQIPTSRVDRNHTRRRPNSLRPSGRRAVHRGANVPQTLTTCGRRCLLGGSRSAVGRTLRTRASSDSGDFEGSPATLTPETEWRFVLTVKPPSTTESAEDIPEDAPKVDVALRCVFSVDEGYEPPQGTLTILEDERGFVNKGGVHRWKLSEEEGTDPLDKGGLWIWGLFKEPLYPFMFLEMQVNALTWPGGENFPGGQLSLKVPHGRGKQRGVVLSEGVLSLKTVVKYDADLMGLSKANISEVRPCGTVRIAQVSS